MFILALLGCADGVLDCRTVATLPTHYATRAQCLAATEAALLSAARFDYPTVTAECRSAGKGMSRAREEQGKIRAARG